jgi:hypothetical protein
VSDAAIDQPRGNRADVVAGYLATFAIFLAAIAAVYRPVRLAPAAAVIALVAAALAGRRSSRIAQLAIAAAVLGWIIGMTFAVTTERPLW